jgi:hypothetical protein
MAVVIMRSVEWRRFIANGIPWDVIHNLVWGFAWFFFMRSEWLDAFKTILSINELDRSGPGFPDPLHTGNQYSNYDVCCRSCALSV